MSTPAKPGEVDAQERSLRARSLLIQATLWAPSMAERDIILEVLAEFPDPSETAPARWPGQAAPANTAGSAALRNGTAAATAAVVSIKHSAASVSRNSRLSTSHHFHATTSLLHITTLTILLFNPTSCSIHS